MVREQIIYKIYKELEWIPEYLSSSVYNLSKLSFSREDLKQELKMKLWESINTYFTLIKQGNKPKINIRRYCHTACLNKKVDFIRMCLAEKRNQKQVSLAKIDVGKKDIQFNIEFSENEELDISDIEIDNIEEKLYIKIDGIDILSVTNSLIEKMLFKDYIIGFTHEELSCLYGLKKSKINNIIFRMKKDIRKLFKDYVKDLDFGTLLYLEENIVTEVEEDENNNKNNNGNIDKKTLKKNNKIIDKHRRILNKFSS